MTKNRFVLDTNAVIFLTKRSNVIPPDREKELNDADLFMSVITEIELFSKSELPPDEEANLHAFLSDRISIIDLTDDIKKETIILRRTVKHKLPDCIVAATAIALNATLLTSDTRLLHLEWQGFNVKNIV
jgi:predicted nucleic acid-binding protein